MNKRFNKNSTFLIYFLIVSSVVIIDFFAKRWALLNLANRKIHLFGGLNLQLVFNRGITWGMFSFTSNLAFTVLTLVILLVVIAFFVHTLFAIKTEKKTVYFEFLIIGGALSNILDRFLYKGVVDFIDFYIGTWHWPTFNLADACVVIGVFGILGRSFLSWLYSKKLKN